MQSCPLKHNVFPTGCTKFQMVRLFLALSGLNIESGQKQFCEARVQCKEENYRGMMPPAEGSDEVTVSSCPEEVLVIE